MQTSVGHTAFSLPVTGYTINCASVDLAGMGGFDKQSNSRSKRRICHQNAQSSSGTAKSLGINGMGQNMTTKEQHQQCVDVQMRCANRDLDSKV